MEDLLVQTGLNDIQAKAYLHLLKTGEAAPPAIAKALGLTRSNAYKVLDKLVELNLITRIEVNKKFVYRAEDPITLTGLVAEERNRVLALEKNVRDAMDELRRRYVKSSGGRSVQTFYGNDTVASLYKNHIGSKQPIYIVESGDDKVAALDILKISRSSQALQTDDYTTPVEWSVSGDELLIITFEKEASAIRICNQAIAKAFIELWQLLDRSLRRDPDYKKLPKQAKRKI